VISHRVERIAARSTWLHRRAPVAKILGFSLLTLAILTEFHFGAARMAAYAALTLGLILAGRLPLSLFARRAALVAPILLLAAALPWLSQQLGDSTVRPLDARLLLAKGLLAVFLLTSLAASTRFTDLLAGLERLRAPAILRLLASLMYRYVPLLQEEWSRMELARRSRTPGEPRRRPLGLLGRQIANLFLRAWHRADRLQAAMDARAFSGRFPRASAARFALPDAAFLALMTAAAAAIRFSGGLLDAR
jgi:cobalt/nickel transport system permease protein